MSAASLRASADTPSLSDSFVARRLSFSRCGGGSEVRTGVRPGREGSRRAERTVKVAASTHLALSGRLSIVLVGVVRDEIVGFVIADIIVGDRALLRGLGLGDVDILDGGEGRGSRPRQAA